jgi:uncharacterized protein YabN with tetrapyrrole methylase and pyrophosphatase domain
MRSVKYDKEKHEREIEAKKKLAIEEERRRNYLKSLSQNHSFQRFVVERIFKKNIAELTDTRKIIAGMKKDTTKEEIGDLVMQSIIAAKMLEKILSEIMN